MRREYRSGRKFQEFQGSPRLECGLLRGPETKLGAYSVQKERSNSEIAEYHPALRKSPHCKLFAEPWILAASKVVRWGRAHHGTDSRAGRAAWARYRPKAGTVRGETLSR